MRIEIIRGTVVDGAAVLAGDVLDVDTRTAELLVAIGKARECVIAELTEDEKAKLSENPAEIKETALKSAPEKRKK